MENQEMTVLSAMEMASIEQVAHLEARLKEKINKVNSTKFDLAKEVALSLEWASEIWKNAGYSSAYQFYADRLGWKKQSVQNMVAVGRRPDLLALGEQGYTFTNTEVLVRVPEDKLKEKIEEGVISPEISLVQTREKVNEILGKEPKVKKEKKEDVIPLNEEQKKYVIDSINDMEFVIKKLYPEFNLDMITDTVNRIGLRKGNNKIHLSLNFVEDENGNDKIDLGITLYTSEGIRGENIYDTLIHLCDIIR